MKREETSDETTIAVTGKGIALLTPSRFTRLSSLNRILDHLSSPC